MHPQREQRVKRTPRTIGSGKVTEPDAISNGRDISVGVVQC